MSNCPYCGAQVHPGYSKCPSCRRPIQVAVAGQAPRPQKSTGSVLMWVGCGVVALVALLGIIAALLIPNFLDALQKAKQKRTVADMMSLGAAVVSYWSDKGHYPQAEELAAELVPAYTPQVPTQDGWGRPLHYVCAEQRYSGCASFVLASAGRDGVFERDDLTAYVPATIAPTDYDADIVYRDGAFVRRPAPATSTR